MQKSILCFSDTHFVFASQEMHSFCLFTTNHMQAIAISLCHLESVVLRNDHHPLTPPHPPPQTVLNHHRCLILQWTVEVRTCPLHTGRRWRATSDPPRLADMAATTVGLKWRGSVAPSGLPLGPGPGTSCYLYRCAMLQLASVELDGTHPLLPLPICTFFFLSLF